MQRQLGMGCCGYVGKQGGAKQEQAEPKADINYALP